MKLFLFTVILSIFCCLHAVATNPLAPSDLKVSDKVSPVGTSQHPFFGWMVNDVDRNEVQTAYQVLVSSSPKTLVTGDTDVWDSGKVNSSKQNYIYCKGKALKPGTRYFWKVRTWDKDGNPGPYAVSAHFDTGLFTAKDWEGSFWIKRNSDEPNQYTYFRKNIILPNKLINRAVVYISACHNYDLYLNGSRIGKGQAYHYPKYAYYNAYDITASLKKHNTFATMTHWFGGGQGRPKGDSRLMIKIVVDYTDGTYSTYGSDSTWKQKAVTAFIPNTAQRNGEGVGYIDFIDSRNFIEDWFLPGYGDQDWQPAFKIGSHPNPPFTGELQPDLTRLKEKKVKPASVKRLGMNTYLIDLGKVSAGVPQIVFEGGKRGDTVAFQAGFVLNADSTLSETITQHTDLSYYFVLNGKKAVFEPLEYLGYRYLKVSNCPTILTSKNVSFNTRWYELEPAKANFQSSSAMLNRVWDLMTNSLILGAQEGFVDTPTREKGQFLSDAWSQGTAAMKTMGERGLNQRMLTQFLQSQEQFWQDGRMNAVYPNSDGKRDIPDFTQQYLFWVWDYFMETGNISFLEDNYLKLRRVAEYQFSHINPVSGLIQTLSGGSGPYKYGIIDWPAPMRFGYDMETDTRTVINAYGYGNFFIMHKIAAIVGRSDDEIIFHNRALSLAAAINKKLMNTGGVYADGLKSDGTISSHVSQHANMFPLALGFTPHQHIPAVLDVVKEQKMSVGMVTLRFLPQSLGVNNQSLPLLNLYTNPDWNGWAKTVALGGTATWESWNALERNDSMSHPWGASGLVGIQEYFLGIRPITPQYERINVRPLDFHGELVAVSGLVPTDRGTIKVKWERLPQAFHLCIRIPVNVTANVYLPSGDTPPLQVMHNGQKATATYKDGYVLFEHIGSGLHVFDLTLHP